MSRFSISLVLRAARRGKRSSPQTEEVILKTSRTMTAVAVLALSLGAAGGAAHAASLINDGDFSNPNQNGGYSIYSAGINGWVNDNGDGVEIGNSAIYGLACENAGCQNLEVNANTFDTDSQTVTGLVVGDTYDLSFLYGERSSGGPQML